MNEGAGSSENGHSTRTLREKIATFLSMSFPFTHAAFRRRHGSVFPIAHVSSSPRSFAMSDWDSSACSSSICSRAVSPPDTQIKSLSTFCAICRSAYILSPTTAFWWAVLSGLALQQKRVRLTKNRARFGRSPRGNSRCSQVIGRCATGWRVGR